MMKISFALVCLLIAFTQARQFITIDSFETSQPPLFLIVPNPANPSVETWYAPGDPVNRPIFAIHDSSDSLSGQRDVILGYITTTPPNSVSIISIVGEQLSIAFPLAYAGGAYVQWDGDDSAADATILSFTDGIGSGPSSTLPESDGFSIDFTSFGRADRLGITITSDLDVSYSIDVFDIENDFSNTITFVNIPPSEEAEVRYNFLFTDPRWSLGSAFDWDEVIALQVRVNTVEGYEDQAVDTAFYQFGLLGFIIEGIVFIDCGCDDIEDSLVSGEEMHLFLDSAPTNILATEFTDASGFFSFSGFPAGTYRVCFEDQFVDDCNSVDGCRTFVFEDEIDPPQLRFGIAQVTSLVGPPDVTIECGDCTTVACLGSATATVCGGGSSQIDVADDSDITTLPNCDQQFTRIFRDQGQTAVQTITIVDTIAPVVVVPAQAIVRQCDDNVSVSFTEWVADDGGATFSDCRNFNVINDATGAITCGSVSVTFTAIDECGQSTSTSASYTIEDNSAPTFTTDPSDQTASCDEAGNSDFNAFNAWLADNGGAVITDNCSSFGVTNSFVDGTLQRGCSESVLVTFTATDACNNVSSRGAVFTITDNSGPSINPQARDQSAECNANSASLYQSWLDDNAGARAVDDCGSASVTFTDDSNNAPAPFGCSASRTVTFIATDACFQSASTTATFSVVDTQPPVLDSPASPFSSQCDSGNDDLGDWLADAGGARATDVCTGNVAFTNNFDSIDNVDCTSTAVTFTACDICNECVVTTASFSVVDNEAPSFSITPQDLSLDCGTDSQTSYENWVATSANAVAFDNCASSNEIVITNNAPSLAPVFTGSECTASVDVAFIARDPCNNSSPASVATFSITDNDAPVITVFPTDQTESCGPNANTAYNAWRNDNAGARATDACSTAFFTNNGPNSVSLPANSCIETFPVTFTATDSCGNSTPVSASFTIADFEAPTLITPASDDSSECNQAGIDAWLADNGGARATDNCSGVVFTNNFVQFSGGCTETAFVTFTATDACGLAVDTSATYSVTDSVAPSINPQASPRSVPCDNNTGSELAAWLSDDGGARATDACQDDNDLIWSNDFSTAVIGCDFATVTFTVTDACGNSRSTTSTFTSVDNDAPTFSPEAQDLTVECNGSGNTGDFSSFVANRGGSVPVDQCALSFTFSDNAPATGPASCGSVVVNFTVEDECGNAATTSARYTVEDSFAPSFTSLATDLTVECDGTGNAEARNAWVADNGGAVAFDTCASVVTYTQTRTDTVGDSCATTDIYQFTASDSCGNSEFVTAGFTVRDFAAPVFTVDPTPASYECDGAGNLGQIQAWVNDNGGARATDSCQGSVTFTDDFNGNGLFTCVSTTVTFTASDNCGNVASRSSTVTVDDTVDPIFSFFPSDITVPCDADITTDVLGFAVATDACSGELFVSLSEVAFDEPAVGDCPGDHIITRTFSAFDDCGNSVSRDQVVTVNIARASGPCDPVGCECDDCCPPAAPSNCLAVDCQAAPCNSVPCSAATCTCGANFKSATAGVAKQVEELPQCKPVYIYVNDDDDTPHDMSVYQPRMLVTNEALHL